MAPPKHSQSSSTRRDKSKTPPVEAGPSRERRPAQGSGQHQGQAYAESEQEYQAQYEARNPRPQYDQTPQQYSYAQYAAQPQYDPRYVSPYGPPAAPTTSVQPGTGTSSSKRTRNTPSPPKNEAKKAKEADRLKKDQARQEANAQKDKAHKDEMARRKTDRAIQKQKIEAIKAKQAKEEAEKKAEAKKKKEEEKRIYAENHARQVAQNIAEGKKKASQFQKDRSQNRTNEQLAESEMKRAKRTAIRCPSPTGQFILICRSKQTNQSKDTIASTTTTEYPSAVEVTESVVKAEISV
ncbi:hypothetical protein NX059_000187 [Plenodomus lindquistii]|nr:hypothetical protein NX059_000187 [Plenodomus lindquistii]